MKFGWLALLFAAVIGSKIYLAHREGKKEEVVFLTNGLAAILIGVLSCEVVLAVDPLLRR